MANITKNMAQAAAALLLLFIIAMPPTKAAAEEQEPINITADHAETTAGSSKATASGNVVIKNKGKIYTGDKSEINRETGEGHISGNAKYYSNSLRMTADRFDFSNSSGLGSAKNAKGVTPDGHTFTAKKMTKIREGKFELEEPTLTTCDPEDPSWLFSAGSATIWMESIVLLHNMVFYMNDFPVFYSPIWIAPAVTKRTSGFINPEFGSSTRDGSYQSLEYYLNINDSQDATLGVNTMDKRGVAFETEYRYMLSEESGGKVNYNFIDDKVFGKTLWDFNAKAKQSITDNLKLKTQLEFESETSYAREFGSTLNQSTKRYQDSFVHMNYHLDGGNVSLTGRRLRELVYGNTTNRDIYYKLPELAFSITPSERFDSPIVAGIRGSVARFGKETVGNTPSPEKVINRIHARPYLALPTTPVDGMSLMPWVEGVASWYDKNDSSNSAFDSYYYKAGLDMEPFKLYKVFGKGDGSVKHIITPLLGFKYVPGYDISGGSRLRVPTLDNLDADAPQSLASFSLLNEALLKTAGGGIRQILRLNISQGYDFREASRKLTSATDKRKPLSNLTIDLDTKPADWLLLDVLASYNHYTQQADSVQGVIAMKSDYGIYTTYEKTWYISSNSAFSKAAVGYRGGRGISASTAALYDDKARRYMGLQGVIGYSGCCWGVDLTFNSLYRTRTNATTGLAEEFYDNRIFIVFTFNGFGETGKKPTAIYSPRL